MASRLIKLILFAGIVFSTIFVQTSARCQFVVNEYYGYTCELEHVNATNISDIVDLSGDHVGGRTNVHVVSVIVSQTSRLEQIPTIIFTTFFNLEQFTCSSNHLRRIDLPFCGPRMKTIQANANPLLLLQNEAFRGCRTIETLVLIINFIEHIEENAFADLPLLRELIMIGNALVEIQGHLFRNQHQLQYLSLDQGILTSIQPGSFQCKEFLIDLDFRVNRIEKLETGTFTNMLRLRVLNLGTNRIRVIEEGAFANLPLLESIELADNQIAVFDSNLFGTSFPNLNHIGVGSNRIHAIDRKVFRRFPALLAFFGAFNVCFSQNFEYIHSIEHDVVPYLDTCFTNFDEL